MKRLFLVFAAALISAILGPAPTAAHWWWPHHSHSNSADPGARHKDKKAKKTKTRREKHHREGSEPLYSVPKSVGWWHKGPGPAGAGS